MCVMMNFRQQTNHRRMLTSHKLTDILRPSNTRSVACVPFFELPKLSSTAVRHCPAQQPRKDVHAALRPKYCQIEYMYAELATKHAHKIIF